LKLAAVIGELDAVLGRSSLYVSEVLWGARWGEQVREDKHTASKQ
jgi:hypothetical protein